MFGNLEYSASVTKQSKYLCVGYLKAIKDFKQLTLEVGKLEVVVVQRQVVLHG